MNSEFSRRDFIKTSAVAGGVLATNILIPTKSFAEDAKTIKIGLIGCGGRGSGAAKNALTADKNVVLVAMGDAFQDQLESSLSHLKADKEVGHRVQVAAENKFVGLDAYKKVIDSGVDVVLLATPPGFRAFHIKYAVEKNKHVFCEKPVCTDGPSYRSFMESARLSKQKNLALVAGFCWRSNLAERAVLEKVHNGEIGDIRTIYGTYNTGGARGVVAPQPNWKPLEAQLRNWMHFTWLSGDHYVEQAVHNVDLTNWVMKNEMPVSCVAHGGRQIRPDPMFGHIFDHFSVVYEWANGTKGFIFARQQSGCASDNTEHVYGTKGTAHIMLFNGVPYITDLQKKKVWKYDGDKNTPNMYEVEHQELFETIRKGNPRNDGEWLANSSMMAVMGRMAAYTGQEISWEDAINSKEKLVPDEANIRWESAPPVPPLAMPGQTQFS